MFRRRVRRRLFGRVKPAFTKAKRRTYRKTRYSRKKSFRTRRFGRRRFKRTSRLTRRRRFDAKVIKALSNDQVFTAEYAGETTVPANAGIGVGVLCTYVMTEVYDNAVTVDNVHTVELFDYRHLGKISDFLWVGSLTNSMLAAGANGTNSLSSFRSKYIVRGVARYQLRNQSTEPVRISAFYCRPRHPLMLSNAVPNPNIYQWMSLGFANNGLDVGNILPSNNHTMHTARFSPFQSYDFCRDFKIMKTKQLRIDPGQSRVCYLKRRWKTIRPSDLWYVNSSSVGASWFGATQKYSYHGKEMFILFKIEAAPAGWGSAQATYAKKLATTTPTVILETTFKYHARIVPHRYEQHNDLEITGFDLNGVTAPAIVVPDGDVVGVEADAV